MGQMVKTLLEEQQMSFPTYEEFRKVEVNAKVINEIARKEESTFPEQKDLQKEVGMTIPEMTLYGDVHEKVKNETILELMENERTTKVK